MSPRARSLIASARLLACVLLAPALGSHASVAHADPPDAAPDASESPDSPPEYLDEPPDVGLLPSHRAEWLIGTDAVSLALPAVHPALGVGMGAVRAFDARQRHRLGVHLGVLLAADPENQEPAVHFWPGLRYRFSYHMDDLFDWYLLARADFPLGSDPWRAGSFSPGLGLGVRLARTAAIEGSLMMPIGLLRPIALDGHRETLWGAFGLAITVDLCRVGVDCEPPLPRPHTHDCTDSLYRQARRTCQAATPAQHAQLCAAVMRALDGAEHYPAQASDSTAAFLRGLYAELGGAPEQQALRRQVRSLEATHEHWQARVRTQRADSRRAAQEQRRLLHFTTYAPSAIELRRVLGCYAQPGATRCPALEGEHAADEAGDPACLQPSHR